MSEMQKVILIPAPHCSKSKRVMLKNQLKNENHVILTVKSIIC
jgi:hypothetical protein